MKFALIAALVLAPAAWTQEESVSATTPSATVAAKPAPKPCSMTFDGLSSVEEIPVGYLADYLPLAKQFGADCPAYYSRGPESDNAEYIPAGDNVNTWKTMFTLSRTKMSLKEVQAAYKDMLAKSGGTFEVTDEKGGLTFFHYAIETPDPARGALAGTEYATGAMTKIDNYTLIIRNLDRNPLSPADEMSFTQILTDVFKKKK